MKISVKPESQGDTARRVASRRRSVITVPQNSSPKRTGVEPSQRTRMRGCCQRM